MKRLILAGLTVTTAIVALAVVLTMGVTGAWFSDEVTPDVTTSDATVKVGTITGFPLSFNNLVPDVWTDWKTVSVNNGSSIPADLHVGMHDNGSEVSLTDLLWVQIYSAQTSTNIYDSKISGLFTAWQKVADDLAAGATATYQVRVMLDSSALNILQVKTTNAYLRIYAVQYNGPAPVCCPYNT